MRIKRNKKYNTARHLLLRRGAALLRDLSAREAFCLRTYNERADLCERRASHTIRKLKYLCENRLEASAFSVLRGGDGKGAFCQATLDKKQVFYALLMGVGVL